MSEGSILLVGAVVAILAVVALAVWGAFALSARARRRRAEAESEPVSAPRLGAPAFASAPALTGMPADEVPARIPFGSAGAGGAAHTAVLADVDAADVDAAENAPAEIVAADVPVETAAISYTLAMLLSEAPASSSSPPAPIEMPVELSVRIESAAPAPPAVRPLIDSVPDFSAKPATPAAAAAPAVLNVEELSAAAVAAASELDDAADDMEATIIAGRRNRAWVFESESGQRVPLSAEVVLLGRNPSPLAGFEDAQLVTVRDLGRTVSKTHARVQRHENGWQITDLSSTNGVYLIGPDGNEIELEPGIAVATTDQFILGDMSARIFQEE
ncbi:FHA domain-containing protein [Microterricola viridarii]|uniref:FHA domain-containing protein n=1 Tax=Microterricola viridarii TaxID=412690 RepID=A0A109QWA5_9MICO|nr:FHA domain-containing protein [Microterricola viridarii]AMB57650.1 hypothetical protein AWU67_00875 [Microterricola viridarii]